MRKKLVISALLLIILMAVVLLRPMAGYDLSRVHSSLRELAVPYQSVNTEYFRTDGSINIVIVDRDGRRLEYWLPGGRGRRYAQVFMEAAEGIKPGAVEIAITGDTLRMLTSVIEQHRTSADRSDLVLVSLRGAPRDYARLYGRATVSAAIILAIALVVGAVIAWVARWAIRARIESARYPCNAALAAIDDAKWNWALEFGKSNHDVPTWSDLLGKRSWAGWHSNCPNGGTYTIGCIGEAPTCSVGGPMHTSTENASEIPAQPPKVIWWLKVYSALLCLLCLVPAAFSLVFFLVDPADIDMSATEAHITGAILLVVGLGLFGLCLPPLVLRPRPWLWTYDLVIICLGMTSAFMLPASIPMLIYWLKPGARRYFGKS